MLVNTHIKQVLLKKLLINMHFKAVLQVTAENLLICCSYYNINWLNTCEVMFLVSVCLWQEGLAKVKNTLSTFEDKSIGN